MIKCLRQWFGTFGVPRELSSDGGPEFTAGSTSDFLKSWGVAHRISSAYNPSSNGRAEVAVKAVKRLMRDNLGPGGSLDTDRFLRALLEMRNTPDPDCNISPSEIVFGRPLRDNFLFADYLNRNRYSQRWQDAWSAKEEALRARFIRTSETINRHSRYLSPLVVGDKCFIQNQHGPHPKKWHHTGTVVELLPHQKYAIKVDGSGRVTIRNRRYLKRYTPYRMDIEDHNREPRLAPAKAYSDRQLGVADGSWDAYNHSGSARNISHGAQSNLPLTEAAHGEAPVEPEFNTQPSMYSPSTPCTSPPPVTSPTTLSAPVDVSPVGNELNKRHRDKAKVPLALRRLKDFNAPGLKELG